MGGEAISIPSLSEPVAVDKGCGVYGGKREGCFLRRFWPLNGAAEAVDYYTFFKTVLLPTNISISLMPASAIQLHERGLRA
jgi:hypothetical protein